MKFKSQRSNLPLFYYNVAGDLSFKLPGLRLRDIPKAFALLKVIPMRLIWAKIRNRRFFRIPEEVLDIYSTYRPTPLVRASNLEKHLDLPENIAIYYKDETVSPTGSYKMNAALPWVYFGKQAGYKRIVCDTVAGQWGIAVAKAASIFGLECKIYMVSSTYHNKPRITELIKSYGAQIEPTPEDSPNLTSAMAVSDALATGSLLPILHLEMFQSIIGLETEEECRRRKIMPDVMIGSVGSGINFTAFIAPFLKYNPASKNKIKFLGIESTSAPKLTRGEYRYDSYDSFYLTPAAQTYNLDKTFKMGITEAEGLRVSSATVLLSALYQHKKIGILSYDEKDIRESGKIFFQTQGISPAPESVYSVAAAIKQALYAKEQKRGSNILFILSGKN